MPPLFERMAPDQQRDVLAQLRRVDSAQRQGVVDEWVERCRSGAVRKPVAYLFGLIRRALAGEFRLWAANTTESPATPAPSRLAAEEQTMTSTAEPPATSASAQPGNKLALSEIARVNLAAINQLLGRPVQAQEQLMQLATQRMAQMVHSAVPGG